MGSNAKSFFAALSIAGLFLSFAQATDDGGAGAPPRLESHVVEVVPPEKSGDSLLILLSSFGRVLRLDPQVLPEKDRAVFESVAGTERRVRIEFRDLGEQDLLLSLEEIDSAPIPEIMQLPADEQPEDFREWDTGPEMTWAAAKDLFGFMRSKNLRERAECFHRAYLWAYDAWRERSDSTQKVFLFFTRKYLREYNYSWWFHVTPYVTVNQQPVVLDPTYAWYPVDMQSWTNIFMRNDAYCPLISAYYGWQSHYPDRYCYRRQVSMYYYHPARVQAADRGGYVITTWDQQGLRNSQAARPYSN